LTQGFGTMLSFGGKLLSAVKEAGNVVKDQLASPWEIKVVRGLPPSARGLPCCVGQGGNVCAGCGES
jgi:hypothetical protein